MTVVISSYRVCYVVSTVRFVVNTGFNMIQKNYKKDSNTYTLGHMYTYFEL